MPVKKDRENMDCEKKNKLLKAVEGFTMVEVIFVLSTVSLIAANIAVPNYIKHMDTAKKNICYKNMRTVEYSDAAYSMDTGKDPAVIGDLVKGGYLDNVPECPSGGIYAWTNDRSSLICSVHGVIGGAVTSVGDTPRDISSNFVKLLRDYYDENGRYPGGGWKKAMKQLDIDPGEWEDGVDGVIYRVSGPSVIMKVEKGYKFIVEQSDGKEITLEKGESLVYSAETDVWHYGEGKKMEEVNIDTLEVSKK